MLIGFAGEEAQGGQHALARRLPRDIAAFDADRIGGEPEAYRGDTGERGRRIAVGYEAIPGIAGLPEKAERAFLEIREERMQGHGMRRIRGHRMRITQHADCLGRRRCRLGNGAIPGTAGLPEEAQRALLEIREERIQGRRKRAD